MCQAPRSQGYVTKQHMCAAVFDTDSQTQVLQLIPVPVEEVACIPVLIKAVWMTAALACCEQMSVNLSNPGSLADMDRFGLAHKESCRAMAD